MAYFNFNGRKLFVDINEYHSKTQVQFVLFLKAQIWLHYDLTQVLLAYGTCLTVNVILHSLQSYNVKL